MLVLAARRPLPLSATAAATPTAAVQAATPAVTAQTAAAATTAAAAAAATTAAAAPNPALAAAAAATPAVDAGTLTRRKRQQPPPDEDDNIICPAIRHPRSQWMAAQLPAPAHFAALAAAADTGHAAGAAAGQGLYLCSPHQLPYYKPSSPELHDMQ